MHLGDSVVSIKVSELGSYTINVHMNIINGGNVTGEYKRVKIDDLKASGDPIQDLAAILAILSVDLPK